MRGMEEWIEEWKGDKRNGRKETRREERDDGRRSETARAADRLKKLFVSLWAELAPDIIYQ